MKSPILTLTLTTVFGFALVSIAPALRAQTKASGSVTSDPPAEVPSPSLSKLDNGSAKQPQIQGASGNQNPPATLPSPYLRQQQNGDVKPPQAPRTMGNPNPPATLRSPYIQQQTGY